MRARRSLIANLSNDDLIINSGPFQSILDNPITGLQQTKIRQGFVWICHTRDVSRMITAAVDQCENSEWKCTPKFNRWVNGSHVGNIWVIHAWGLTDPEINALQRVAVKIDPTAFGMVWDENKHFYRK